MVLVAGRSGRHRPRAARLTTALLALSREAGSLSAAAPM